MVQASQDGFSDRLTSSIAGSDNVATTVQTLSSGSNIDIDVVGDSSLLNLTQQGAVNSTIDVNVSTDNHVANLTQSCDGCTQTVNAL